MLLESKQSKKVQNKANIRARGLKFSVLTLLASGLCLLIILLGSIAFAPKTHAAQTVPYKINFQGRLTDATGNIKPDGLYNMRIRLYSAVTGGTLLGTEMRDGAYRVQVTNGLFSIQIGDNSVLTPSMFTSYPLYLEIELPTPATATCTTVGCGTWTEGPMSPRSPLGASPYAFNADTVDGIDGINIARKDTVNTFSDETTFNGQLKFNFDANFSTDMLLTYNQLWNGSAYVTQATGTAASLENHLTEGFKIKVSSWRNGFTDSQNITALATLAVSDNIRGVVDNGVIYPDNLISNPSFEFGCNGWNSNCTSTATDTSSSGLASLKITQANTTSNYDISSRFVATQPGDQFFTSIKVKTSATTTGGGGLYVIFYDASGVVVGYSNGDWSNPGTSWATKSWVHTTPAGAAYASLVATARGGGTTAGTWNFDDAYMYKVNKTTPMSFRNDIDSATSFLVQRASGENMFVADTASNAIKIGGGDTNQDGGATLIVLDNKNTSGDPTGVNGAMYYNANSNKFRCYEASEWKDCISSQNAQNSYYYNNDFMYSVAPGSSGTSLDGTLYSGYVGTGAGYTLNAGEAGHPGIARLNVASAGINGFVNSTGTANSLLLGNGNTWSFATALKLSALSDGTNTYTARAGFYNTNVTNALPTYGCYMSYSNAAPQNGNWMGYCANGGTGATSTCTISGAVTTDWNNISITINADATVATFIANGQSCAISDPTNIPSTIATGLGVTIHKTAGTTQRYMLLDYVQAFAKNLSR